MKLQDISKKTLIIVLLIIVLLLYIYFYSNKQENISDNKGIYNKLKLLYSKTYPQRGVLGIYIDTEETRNNIGNINFNQNQIFMLYDAPNNKMLVFDFDNAIAIYDYNNNNMTIYTPISKPNMVNYKLNITNNQENYTLNIGYMMNDGSGMGSGQNINNMDLFNLNNFNKLFENNPQVFEVFDTKKSNFDPTQEISILPQYNIHMGTGGSLTPYSSQADTDIGIIEIHGKKPISTPINRDSQQYMMSASQKSMLIGQDSQQDIGIVEQKSKTVKVDPIEQCISQEVIQSVKENVNKLYIPRVGGTDMDYTNAFMLNYNNYNIIKTQIDLFKTITDDQIVCILDSSLPNFCDDFNNELSKDNTDDINRILNNVKTSHQILSLYHNQLLDIKTIVLPRVLNVINKCNNLTKTNKLKVLNGLRDLLYTAEYISSILGNNWDLIKNIDNTIKNLN